MILILSIIFFFVSRAYSYNTNQAPRDTTKKRNQAYLLSSIWVWETSFLLNAGPTGSCYSAASAILRSESKKSFLNADWSTRRQTRVLPDWASSPVILPVLSSTRICICWVSNSPGFTSQATAIGSCGLKVSCPESAFSASTQPSAERTMYFAKSL